MLETPANLLHNLIPISGGVNDVKADFADSGARDSNPKARCLTDLGCQAGHLVVQRFVFGEGLHSTALHCA